MIQPLLAKHRQECCEERNNEASVEDGLNLDYRTGRACPLREGGNVVSEGGVVHLVNKNAEEGCSFVTRVGLQLRLELGDEGSCHSRKQTGLQNE